MIELITDRTANDKKRADTLQLKLWKDMSASEKSEWTNGLKGRYNYTDMNRVGQAVEYLQELLTDCGYSVDAIHKQDWSNTQIATSAELSNYITDIIRIRDTLPVISTTPIAPETFYPMSYQKANDIERILIDVNMVTEKMIANFYYLNEIYLGEV